MKKTILLITLFLLLSSICFGQDIIFRSVYWGESKAQVQKAEKLELIDSSEDTLFYKTELANLDSVVSYSFNHDKLYLAGYLFDETHTNTNDYLDDYVKIHNLLVKKYGDSQINYEWKNDLYKDDSQHYGLAIAMGALKINSQWNLDGYSIYHIITGDNLEINHALMYKSEKYAPTEDEEDKEDMSNI